MIAVFFRDTAPKAGGIGINRIGSSENRQRFRLIVEGDYGRRLDPKDAAKQIGEEIMRAQ